MTDEAKETAAENCPKLRVVFGGMDGRFSTVPLRYLAAKHQLVGIVHTAPRRQPRGLLMNYLRGTPGAGNLQRFAEHYGCQYLSIGNMYGVELVQFLDYLRPDIFCLSNFSVILPPTIYEIPKYGTINLHLSKLPQYRGPMPWLWMFYDGAEQGGITVHQLDDGEDSGPILKQEDFAIPVNVTASELADAVLPQGARLLTEAVDDIAKGIANPQPQASKEGTRRARFLKPHENLIDWENWGCERVGAFLRGASIWYEAFPPLPGFWREYLPGETGAVKGKPGQLVWRPGGGWVVCKDGRVPVRLHPSYEELGRLLFPPALVAALYYLL
ncbi:MAG: formyltransferase family protein [bacterium]|nr:formyltransferase family protein [bacterium]